MKHHISKITLLATLVMMASACVSNKKYNSALDEIARMKVDSSVMAHRAADVRYDESTQLLETSRDLRYARVELDSLKRQAQHMQQRLDNLVAGLNKAVPTLENEKLETYVDKGYLHLGLPHRVLFNSGGKVLSDDGRHVVKEVAALLKSQEADIMILGHTDSEPFVSSSRDNWELSLERTQAVMELMVESGMPVEKILLAGRSKYQPFMENDTQIGRMLNRRIEVVLMPDLGQLQSMMQNAAEDGKW
ncbi:MAG: OmpA family protein [Cyclobacteriaceae bacterium]|nr:OmpA family protein [Cyclobacteriaceae bacterium]